MEVEVVVERSVQMEQTWFDRQDFAPPPSRPIYFSWFSILFIPFAQHSSVLPSNCRQEIS